MVCQICEKYSLHILLTDWSKTPINTVIEEYHLQNKNIFVREQLEEISNSKIPLTSVCNNVSLFSNTIEYHVQPKQIL